MDFSSSSRALSSLLRRQPTITNPEILNAAESLLKQVNESSETDEYPSEILQLISSGIVDRWESLAVGMHLSIEYLSNVVKHASNDSNKSSSTAIYPDGPRIPEIIDTPSIAPSPQSKENTEANVTQLIKFCQTLTHAVVGQLEHLEPRVRTLIAKAVGAHGQVCSIFSQEYPEFSTQRHVIYKRITSSLLALLNSGRQVESMTAVTDGSKVAMDDTTGWKSLETSLHALAAFLDAPITHNNDEEDIDALLESLNYCATKHINRHVRAASLQALERYVIKGCTPNQLIESPLQPQFADILSTTLADNWSQVRMAACTLCRVLFQTLISAEVPVDSYFPKLLPRMCLNRFYLAQGVKLYSHDTWKIVMGNQGIQRVVEHAGGLVRYYVKCCDADNHVVREAACQAVAELAQKVGTNPDYAPYLEPFVPTLLQALLMCFHDESWPVRDQACLACGTFAKAYPELCLPELPTLWERWSSQLTDQIWSVREGAAVAIGDAMIAFGPQFGDKVLDYIEELLPGAKNEPPMSQEEYDKRQNDYELHSNSQLYSCGSLAPKLRKGGCSDCLVTRPKALWEQTDGCIYMIRELCAKNGTGELIITDEELYPMMEELADVARVKHFPLAEDLRCTLWKCLPEMARGLGKKRFKSKYLNLFLDLMIRNLERGSANSEHDAAMCARELYGIVGEGILKGRVRDVVGDHGVEIMSRCCAALNRGGHGPTGNVLEGDMSPFGPTMMEGNVPPFGPPTVGGSVAIPKRKAYTWAGEEAF